MREALDRLARAAPGLGSRIIDLSAIIGFRNVLAHGYDVVDHEVVWETIQPDLPVLAREAARLLQELDERNHPDEAAESK
jgi:uncharacterized protein with HEPN domain